MSIRLNKAIRELNIGLQTAVEFLKKRSDLGEVRDDVSFKLNDDQYHALVEEFKSDKEVRSQAEKLFPKHQKEKKRTSERKEQKPGSPVREATTQKYTVLGKIDLDSLNRKPSQKPSQKPRQEQSAGSAQDAPASSSAASHAPSAAAPKQPAAAEPKPVQKAVAKPEAARHEAEPQQPKQEQPAQQQPAQPSAPSAPQQPAKEETPAAPQANAEESKIFTLKSEKKLAPKVNVLGKIDLDAINQSTRPK